ncbi:AAA family ATPase [Gemmobacter sp. LW-1]|uniref:AAA family ATPase n=1 Tax=Gemmobacter sp. LW-1 TaxID=1529005 RepID=UPI0006C75980|nr:AAA family ATPase [Gemmobacter sp. LW-1]
MANDSPIAAGRHAATAAETSAFESARDVLAFIEPADPEDFRDVARGIKSLGPLFEGLFIEWAIRHGMRKYRASKLWAITKPDPDALEDLTLRKLDALNRTSRYQPLSGVAISALVSVEWRVKNVFPAKGLGVIGGPFKSGKSFLLFDMLFTIAEGGTWFGFKTKAAPVLYVSFEGNAGVRQRAAAWAAFHGRPVPANFAAILQPFALTFEQDIQELANICPQGCVVAIDTLNRASPGLDENSGKDMGVIIAAASRLQRLIGGLVILVHHTGKDAEKGLRGHSSFPAAVDGSLIVGRDGDARTFTLDKVKDGEDGKAFGFKLEIVKVGKDEDGDDITSCVVVPSELPTKIVGNGPTLSDGELFLKSTFWEAFTERQKHDYGCDPRGVPVELWRKFFDRKSHLENSASKKRTFYRDLGKMIVKGFFLVENNIALPMLPQNPANSGPQNGER